MPPVPAPCSLLGFPIQFLGLVVTPYLALRYYGGRGSVRAANG